MVGRPDRPLLGLSTGVELVAVTREVAELPPVIVVTSQGEAEVDRGARGVSASD